MSQSQHFGSVSLYPATADDKPAMLLEHPADPAEWPLLTLVGADGTEGRPIPSLEVDWDAAATAAYRQGFEPTSDEPYRVAGGTVTYLLAPV